MCARTAGRPAARFKGVMYKERILIFWRVVLSLLLGLVAFSIGLYLGWFKDPDWFSRFGSLVVLFGVIAEYQVGRLPFLRPTVKLTFEVSTEPERKKIFFFNDPSMAMCSHVMAITGTLIWGFGDKFLCWLKYT